MLLLLLLANGCVNCKLRLEMCEHECRNLWLEEHHGDVVEGSAEACLEKCHATHGCEHPE